MARRIGSATALEVRASGAHWVFAPCVAVSLLSFTIWFLRMQETKKKTISDNVYGIWQVCKDPRWGRCLESYSEDTDVVCNMTSIVSGLQGTPPQGHPAGYPFLAGRSILINPTFLDKHVMWLFKHSYTWVMFQKQCGCMCKTLCWRWWYRKG